MIVVVSSQNTMNTMSECEHENTEQVDSGVSYWNALGQLVIDYDIYCNDCNTNIGGGTRILHDPKDYEK